MDHPLKYGNLHLLLVVVSIFSGSCDNSGTGESGLDPEIMEAEKPPVDTARVLETLDLYRAKRHESLQEAFHAGAENVHKLVLYGRKIGTLSPEIGRLTYLASLDVALNDLTELPQELSELHYLQGFYANGNRLTDFPEQILLLPVLAKIDLSDNQISEIPGEIKKMDQLTYLSIDNNALTEIPVQLYDLGKLRVLELAGNGFSNLPEGISNLKQLRKLDVSNNQLTSLPGEITTLTGNLAELEIQGNQIPRGEIEWLKKAMPQTRIRY